MKCLIGSIKARCTWRCRRLRENSKVNERVLHISWNCWSYSKRKSWSLREISVSQSSSSLFCQAIDGNAHSVCIGATVEGLAQTIFKNSERRWKCTIGLTLHNAPPSGSGNRMVAVHPIYFIVNLLDLRFKIMGLSICDADQKSGAAQTRCWHSIAISYNSSLICIFWMHVKQGK
jgi:hypothetical protein